MIITEDKINLIINNNDSLYPRALADSKQNDPKLANILVENTEEKILVNGIKVLDIPIFSQYGQEDYNKY